MSEATKGRSFVADTWLRLWRTPGALIGAVIVGLIVFRAIFAAWLAHVDRLAQDLSQQAVGPNAHHLFGTDKLGRDIFARVLFGARISIRIGFVAVGLAITVGTLVGSPVGYLRGRVG